MIKYLPNTLSILRAIASVLLLFFFGDLQVFIPLYLIAGITDVLDGFIARRYKIESTLGARLDSIGDTFFYIVLLLYLFIGLQETVIPYLYSIIFIVAIKVLSIIIGFVKFRKLTMLHTWANKAAGLLIYFVPAFVWLRCEWLILFVVIIALLAAVEEMIILLISKKGKIDLNRKSLFSRSE